MKKEKKEIKCQHGQEVQSCKKCLLSIVEKIKAHADHLQPTPHLTHQPNVHIAQFPNADMTMMKPH